MANQRHRLRDDIRRTFTAYAVVPIFIVAAIALGLAFVSWDRNVLSRKDVYKRQLMVRVAFLRNIEALSPRRKFRRYAGRVSAAAQSRLLK